MCVPLLRFALISADVCRRMSGWMLASLLRHPLVRGCRTLLLRLLERAGQERGGGWCGGVLVTMAMD